MPTANGVDRLISDIQSTYRSLRPLSLLLAGEASRFLPGGNTRSVLHAKPFPFRVASASASELVDVDGNRYVDLLGNFSAGLLGTNPSRVKDAVRGALEQGWGYGAVNEAEVDLAKLVCERYRSIEQVRFTNSGTEANLMAISASRLATKKDAIVVFEGAYHGSVLSFGALGKTINSPYDWIVCEYNSPSSVSDAFSNRGSEIAAVLVEPMLGAGGCIPADSRFIQTLSELCATNESVLIFDEVMTSRLSQGGAQELIGVFPQMTTLGKYLAGGMTFGAFGGSRDIMRHFDDTIEGGVAHGGTFNNNILSMSAGVATLSGLTGEALQRLNKKGERLRSTLNGIFDALSVALCATGWGSLSTIHATKGPVVSYEDTSKVDHRISNALFMFLANEGFYIAPRGYIALSLEISNSEIDAFIIAVERFAKLLASEDIAS